MTTPGFLMDLPLGVPRELADASYKGPLQHVFDGVDPLLQQKHNFVCLKKEVKESYQMYLCQYNDTAGKVHFAVSIKGLFGGDFGLPKPENCVQAAGAGVRALFSESPVLPAKVQKVIDRWLTHSPIDTVVGHSAGARVVPIITEYLQLKNRDVRGVTLNGQINPTDSGIINVCTDGDWLNWFSRDVHRVGPGGHSLDDFKPYAHLTLREIEEGQRSSRLDKMREELPSLEKKFDVEGNPSSETLDEAERFVFDLQRAQEAESRKQQIQQGVVMAAKVGAAVASGLDDWQRGNTAAMAADASARAQSDREARDAELRAQHGGAAASMQMYRQAATPLQMSYWASSRFATSKVKLTRHLGSLKKNVVEWEGIQSDLQERREQASLARAQFLEKKIAKDKRIVSQVLSGISQVCDVAAICASPFSAVEPLSASVAAAGLGFAGRAFSAGAAFADNSVTAAELQRQTEAARLQHQAALLSAQEQQADARRDLHDQAYFDALGRVASCEQIAPWVRRRAMADKVTYWERKLANHESKREALLLEIYAREFDRLEFPAEITGDRATNTVRKREYFLQEGYKKTPACKGLVESEEQLARALRKDQKLLRQEQELADIRDRGYRVAEYWGDFWSPSDEGTKVFAQALDEQVQRYWSNAEERESIMRTFVAFEELAGVLGDRRFQKAAGIGREAYTMADLGRYAVTTAFPNMNRARKGPGSFMENIGGLPKLLSGYLVPTVQFAICGIRIAQLLTEGELPSSKAAIRTRQLKCLNKQLEVLQQSVSFIHRDLTRHGRAIDEGFDQTLLSIRELQEGIKARIRQLKAGFETKLDTQDFDRVTREGKAKLRELKRELAGKSFAKRSGMLLAQAQELGVDISSGVSLPDSPGPLVVPDYVSLLHLNPSHHTATLLSQIEGENLTLPNLQHYLQVVSNYQTAKEEAGRASGVSAQTRETLAEVHKILLLQGRHLQKFMRLYGKAAGQAADAQKGMLKALSRRLDETLKAEKTDRNARAKRVAEQLKAGVTTAQVGASRFGLTSAFANQAKPHLALPSEGQVLAQAVVNYTPKKDAFVGGLKGVTSRLPSAPRLVGGGVTTVGGGGVAGAVLAQGSGIAVTGGAAGGAVGGELLAIVGGAIGAGAAAAAVCAVAAGGVAVTVGNGARRVWLSRDWQEVLKQERRELSTLLKGSSRLRLFDEEGLVRWHLATVKKIRELFVHRITFRASPDVPFRDVYHSGVLGRVSEILTLSGKQSALSRFSLNASVDPYLITQAEIAQLPQFPIQSGDEQLLTNYLQAAASQRAVGGFDQAFLDGCDWVPATEPGGVPLAFPKVLLAIFEQEKRKLAAQGIALTPKYSFKDNGRGRYELSLDFFVGTQKHSSLSVASFDERAVKTFGAPIVKDRVLQHEAPNLNEFLVVAMYASYQKDVGFPGQNTVTLRGGGVLELVAPVDEPFSGVYKLLGEEVAQGSGRMIQFNSDRYGGDDQVMAGKLTYRGEALPLESKDALAPGYKEYCRQYHVLKAMYNLRTDVPTNFLDEHLAGAGLVLNSSGEMDAVYDQMASARKIAGLAEIPVGRCLQRLPVEIDSLGSAHAGLIGAIAKLDPEADFAQMVAAAQVPSAGMPLDEESSAAAAACVANSQRSIPGIVLSPVDPNVEKFGISGTRDHTVAIGDCLFDNVFKHLSLDDSYKSSTELREVLVAHMRAHPDTTIGGTWIESGVLKKGVGEDVPYKSREEFFAIMKTPLVWATEAEIAALAGMINHPIVLFSQSDEPKLYNQGSENEPILLYHKDENHFVSCEPREGISSRVVLNSILETDAKSDS